LVSYKYHEDHGASPDEDGCALRLCQRFYSVKKKHLTFNITLTPCVLTSSRSSVPP